MEEFPQQLGPSSAWAPPPSLLAAVPFGVLVLDSERTPTFANDRWTTLTAKPSEAWLDLLDAARREDLLADLQLGREHRLDVAVSPSPETSRILHLHAVPATKDDPPYSVVTVVDVTDDRAWATGLLDRATHDAMTGLYNRGQFLEFVSHSLARRRRETKGVDAVLFIDVDDLKTTNDTLGHAAGDRLLREVANRVVAAVRPGDVVARYGGDEFTVLCEGLETMAEGEAIARRIVDLVGQPDAVGSGHSVSVGVAFAEDTKADDTTSHAATVVGSADAAMYRAKRQRLAAHDVEESTTLRDLLTIAAHEMRTPLTTIVGYAATLRDEGARLSPEQAEDAAGIIERQSRRLAGMIDDLLDIGRLRNRPPVETGPVDLTEIVSDALEAAPPPEGVVLDASDAGGHVMAAGGDPAELVRIVMNLLVNAYRHGGSSITVGVADLGVRCEISVTDDGPGVPEHLTETMFSPFVHGPAGASTNADGTGLGLALADALAQSSGGELTYRSAQPHGARFSLALPASPDPQDPSAACPPAGARR